MKRKKGARLSLDLYFTLIVMFEVFISIIIAWIMIISFEKFLGIDNTVPVILEYIALLVIISIMFTSLISKSLFEPIKKLCASMDNVAKGDFEIQLEDKSIIHEIQDMYKNFNSMTKELKATEILQTDFVSNVSHEIKTPINAIEGYVMLLQDNQCSETERTEYVERILFNTKRLSELVSNILLLSKLDNQSIEPVRESFSMDEQIRQAIMMYESQWNDKNIEFDIEMSSIYFIGNDRLLLHVWTNLLENAIKFSPVGGHIIIRLSENEEYITYVIEDCGPGISVEAQQHIYDKFYQEDESHRQGGNGLGLALVKKILDIYNADITMENREEKGSRFTLRFPKKVE